jgi:DNA invertase Pin-like site-specific DNA recombinase/uncharacterized protein YndB with AHSA1/START domain
MSESEKIKPSHLERQACVYVRQSTPVQVVYNRESNLRQYRLVERAVTLGWERSRVRVIDEDLGRSGSGLVERTGFEILTGEVAWSRVGLVLSLDVSRVARNNAEWYRLLELCAVTDTLIADDEGLYHPGLFDDRLVLGLKGTMAEAELHVLRQRLDGGIRNKAQRGELRRGLPVGYVWGEGDGDVLFHPDQLVIGAVRTVFQKFAELGSARQVWLWFGSQGLNFPLQSSLTGELKWVTASYTAVHRVLVNPVYAGAYTYGKTRQERYVDEVGRVRKRTRRLPREKWAVLIQDHHPGFIDWETYEMNQKRLAANAHPQTHEDSGPLREGTAWLQGLATCGRCGRRLRVYYRGRHSAPGYYCTGHLIVNGRGVHCLNVGAERLDQAVARAFLAAAEPAGMEAALAAEQELEARHEAALRQWRLQVERARYQVQKAERRYRAVDAENRLVARTLEADWERRLTELATAETELTRREGLHPRFLTDPEREQIRALGADLQQVWQASTTTDRDRKELLRTLLEEVNIDLHREEAIARLRLRWRSGDISELEVGLRQVRTPSIRTDEDTVELVRRLAVYHPDAVIAGVLNRQGRRTATGERFTANRVGNLRRYREIPRFMRPTEPPSEGKSVSIAKAAEILEVAASTLHRWVMAGFIPAEQVTPGAPWRIRLTEQLKARFLETPPPGYVSVKEAKRILKVSRQTIWQRVKQGRLAAVHVRRGRQKGLFVKAIPPGPTLFEELCEERNKPAVGECQGGDLS